MSPQIGLGQARRGERRLSPLAQRGANLGAMLSPMPSHSLPNRRVRHWRHVCWDGERWPDFTPQELACRGTGAFFRDEESFDALQHMRRALGRPVVLTSGHRSPLHNARVGGAPRSAHLAFAADILLAGHDRHALLSAAREAGFTGFGFYETFLHCDRRQPPRHWYGSNRAKQLWNR